jgi:Ca2+-binding EF-hand superfamily protein
MKTNMRNYRGGVTLGLLAISLLNLSPRLLAQACQDGEKMNRWEKRFDANQDGKLDAQETAAKEAARKQAFQRLQGQYDKDGDGKLSESEKAERRAAMETKRKEMIAKFDKDGDGRLSPEERQAAKAAKKAQKEAGQTKKG